MEIPELYELYQAHPDIATDSRKIKAGNLFFALKGPHFNGNLFTIQALAAGAAYAVVDEYEGPENSQIILVSDTLSCLQKLAKFHRQKFQIPVIAVTGSNGKTTTKELVHEVLSTTYKTYTTGGNLNNHIGIPLTILKIRKDAEMAVIEMGANHLNEIASYCEYTLPTHGIITNCGKAHLDGFGGEEGVRKGKGELFDHLKRSNGMAFVMKDYPFLLEMAQGIPEIMTYGTEGADITGEVKNCAGLLEIAITKGAGIKGISTQMVGEYNLPNIMAAVAVGKYFNVEEDKIKSALENYIPSNSRSQLIQQGANKIILDAYNANPSSMKAAIENFAKMEGEDKVLMLGGMMELGNKSMIEHAAIIDLIGEYQWKAVILVGRDFNQSKHPYLYFDTAEGAKEWLKEQQYTNTQILVKGSRTFQMERVLD